MQSGRIYRVGKCWLLQYRKPVLENGVQKTKRFTKKLATYGDQYRIKRDVQPLADAILRPLNAGAVTAESVQTVTEYMDKVFLPYCVTKYRPATVNGYQWMWTCLKPHAPDIPVADFRTMHAERWLQAVAEEKQRSHSMHANLKNFLRSAFRYAKRIGAIDRAENPVKDAAIPRGKPRQRREAYSLDETMTMMEVLPEPCVTAVAVAAMQGLRRAEIQGLKWSDFDFEKNELMVQRAVWDGHVNETKTLASTGAVPLCPPVLPFLEAHRQRNGGSEWVFHTNRGTPMRLAELYKAKMRAPLEKAGIEWRGWHAFRSGTATLLHTLGVEDKIIQQILRHANIQVTLNLYIKPPDAERQAAMAKLGAAWSKARDARKTA